MLHGEFKRVVKSQIFFPRIKFQYCTDPGKEVEVRVVGISEKNSNRILMSRSWFRSEKFIGASDQAIQQGVEKESERRHGMAKRGVGERFLKMLRYVQRDPRIKREISEP